jgi:hypothetical protein
MENNSQKKLIYPGFMDNNRQMKLYYLGCMDKTEKWKWITLCVWKIKNKSSCILMGVWKITNKWSCVPLEISTIASLNSVGHEILSSFIIDPYDNRHMKLYYLVCMDNNRKMVLYSLCVWKITVKWSCIILGV